MRAFKFRPATQIEFALDIILNRRLFCGDWRSMNDPMEGIYAYSSDGGIPREQEIIKGIGDAKSIYKVCALSEDFQSHLLWAHYASGFNGLAIEVNLPDSDPNIKRIRYRGVFEFLDMNRITTEDEAARTILFSKYEEWSYEKEIRVLSTQTYYESVEVKRVIAGHRMNDALFDTLEMVCQRESIEFCTVGIGDEGIDADRVSPRARRRR